MSDPSLPLQNAEEAALRGSEALKSAMGLAAVRLYVFSGPVNAPFPYLTIGDHQVIEDETVCLASSEVFSRVHIWTRVDGDVAATWAQAKAIAGVVRSVLSAPLTVAGFDTTEWQFRSALHLSDPDGRTGHSVVEHRFLLDPA